MAAYGVTDEGNWEDRTILSRVWPDTHTPPPSREDPAFEAQARRRAGAAARAAPRPIAAGPRRQGARGLERARRSGRSRMPGGSSASRAYVAPRPCAAAEAITAGLLAEDGALARSWKDGRATGQGVLEDYAHLADGLLALYEATFDERWFTTARALMDRVLARFADPAGRLLRHRRRPRAARHPTQGPAGQRGPVGQRDGGARPAPAGGVDRRGSVPRRGRARRSARSPRSSSAIRPGSPSGWWRWTSRSRRPSRSRSSATRPTRRRRRSSPRRPAASGRTRSWPSARPRDASAIPLLADRIAIGGRPTAYVCRGFVCRLPVTDPAALRAELGGRRRGLTRQGPATTIVVPVESPSGSWFIDYR